MLRTFLSNSLLLTTKKKHIVNEKSGLSVEETRFYCCLKKIS
ncbi:hypothetical protein BN8_00433 [Fibrisoma limi BUZ 3]|uniref:Uncharacterized protein n=1 Tax=Fibrisoma limi BUZ 3 TaxID=1185876 RepID=I2GC81_9BACT|nr:hypothetical protein BN8_00433 [Fibrisoma limi BUZ 3]